MSGRGRTHKRKGDGGHGRKDAARAIMLRLVDSVGEEPNNFVADGSRAFVPLKNLNEVREFLGLPPIYPNGATRGE